MDDRQLIELIAKGNQSAVQTLFTRHYARVYRFVDRQIGNPSTAEEVANEVFVEVWRGAGRFEGRSAVSTWLLGIASNKAKSELRKRREMPLDERKAERIEDSADDPERVAQKVSKADAILAAIGTLSPEHKEVVELAYYQDLSVGEVADALDIPVNTVKTRMFHARKNLAEQLTEMGIDRGWP